MPTDPSDKDNGFDHSTSLLHAGENLAKGSLRFGKGDCQYRQAAGSCVYARNISGFPLAAVIIPIALTSF